MGLFKAKGSHRHHYHHREAFNLRGSLFFWVTLGFCLLISSIFIFKSDVVQHKLLKRALEPLDLSQIANTDYLLDVTQPLPPLDAKGPFASIGGEPLDWRGISFPLPPPHKISAQWTVYTTCNNLAQSFEIALTEKPSRNLYLLIAGCNVMTREEAPVLEAIIRYTDGSWERKVLEQNADIWPLEERMEEALTPLEALVWRGPKGESLTGLILSLDPGRTPRKIEFKTLETPDQAGVVIFSVLQEKKNWF